jgi:hypothetical protein
MEATMSEKDPSSPPEPVATGDLWGDPHLEADKDQLVRANFLERPTTPPGPDMQTGRVDAGAPGEEGPPVEDLRVAPASPSVWDARPPPDD